MMLFSPAMLIAGEHGGKEHGGTAAKEHGSHGTKAATILKAATALDASDPELAKELRAIAKHLG